MELYVLQRNYQHYHAKHQMNALIIPYVPMQQTHQHQQHVNATMHSFTMR